MENRFCKWVRENLNFFTHLLPFVLSGLALAGFFAWQIITRQPANQLATALAAYLGFGVFMFGASSLFHSREGEEDFTWFNQLDHTAIHVLIAGTGTFHMAVLPYIRSEWVPWLVSYLWTVAVIGIVLRWIWHPENDGAKNKLQNFIYFGMAISAVAAIRFEDVAMWGSGAMWAAMLSLIAYAISARFFFQAGKLEQQALDAGKTKTEAHDAGERYHAIWHIGTFVAYAIAAGAAVL